VAENKPLLVIFAGPNGSGKSTVTDAARRYDEGFPSIYINADDIAKERNIGVYEAALEATRQREACISKKQSFAMETVMSTPEKIELMREAKREKYHVHLEYVTTQSPTINLDRIHNRVLDGGHDVPEEKTLSRYDRSIQLLPEAMKTADTARVYNNSFEHPLLIAEKTKNYEILIYPQPFPSRWNAQKIMKLIGTEKATIISPDLRKKSTTITDISSSRTKKSNVLRKASPERCRRVSCFHNQ
jgi:predicted ABC-type ATPase